MIVFDFIKNHWHADAAQLTYQPIGAAQTAGAPAPPAPVRRGEQYLRITLAEMFLKDDRKWFVAFAPAVYSLVKLSFGDREEIVSHVAGPSGLKDLKAASLNRGVGLNYALTPLVPYNGGDVELEIGLVALPGSNSALRLLKLLTDFSKTLAVPQISLAMGFAQPLLTGIADLVGSNDTQLVLRLHDAFNQGGKPLTSGYFAVVDAPAGRLDPQRLFVRDDRLHYGDALQTARPLTGYNYALVRIDATDSRDDYLALSTIAEPFRKAMDGLNSAVREMDEKKKADKMAEAERYLTEARFAAYDAKELTRIGRRQVVEAIRKEFDDAKQLLGSGLRETGAVARDLAQAMSNAMSPAEARLAGEVRLRELL